MPSASIRIRGAVTTPSAPPTARPHHAIVSSCVPSDLSWDQAIIAAGTRKNESIFGEIQTQIKKKLTMVKKKRIRSWQLFLFQTRDQGSLNSNTCMNLLVWMQALGIIPTLWFTFLVSLCWQPITLEAKSTLSWRWCFIWSCSSCCMRMSFVRRLNHMVIIVISAIIAVLLVVCTQMYPVKVLCP